MKQAFALIFGLIGCLIIALVSLGANLSDARHEVELLRRRVDWLSELADKQAKINEANAKQHRLIADSVGKLMGVGDDERARIWKDVYGK